MNPTQPLNQPIGRIHQAKLYRQPAQFLDPAVAFDALIDSLARLVDQEAYDQWQELDERVQWCDEPINVHVKDDAQARADKELVGVGPLCLSNCWRRNTPRAAP